MRAQVSLHSAAIAVRTGGHGHQGHYTQSHGVSVSCLIYVIEAGGIGGFGVADGITAGRFPHQRRTRCTGVCTCTRRVTCVMYVWVHRLLSIVS